MEVAKAEAEVEEIRAKIDLIKEQVNSEKVEQTVKLAGMGFDKEKLAMERAQTVSEIRKADKEIKMIGKDAKKTEPTKSANKREQGAHIEKGVKSNNKEAA